MHPIQIIVLENQQIILNYCAGIIGYEELMYCKSRLVLEKLSNPSLKLLVDLRDSEIALQQEQVESILLEQIPESLRLNANDIALLISSPMSAIASLVFFNHSDGLNYFDMVFTSLPEALKHLNLKKSHSDTIEKVFETFRKEYT